MSQCPLTTNFVPGRGNRSADVMIVAEAPGQEEDRRRVPLVGMSGKRLDAILLEAGIPLDSLYYTNIEKHRPTTAAGQNRAPKVAEILPCEKYLMHELLTINPSVVIALGGTAAKWFDPNIHLMEEHGFPREVTVSRPYKQLIAGRKLKVSEAGKERPRKKGRVVRGGKWVEPSYEVSWTGVMVPMFHPAFTLRNPNLWPVLAEDFLKLQHRLTHPPGEHETFYKLATNEEVIQWLKRVGAAN